MEMQTDHLINLLVDSYTRGYEDAIKVLSSTSPDKEKLVEAFKKQLPKD